MTPGPTCTLHGHLQNQLLGSLLVGDSLEEDRNTSVIILELPGAPRQPHGL